MSGDSGDRGDPRADGVPADDAPDDGDQTTSGQPGPSPEQRPQRPEPGTPQSDWGPGRQTPGQQGPGQQNPGQAVGWGPPPPPYASYGTQPGPAGSEAGAGPSPQQFGWGAWQPGPPLPPPPPPAPKPGIIALRPLSLGDILDGSLQAIRGNPRAMLGLPAIVGGAFLVLTLFTRYLPGDRLGALRGLSGRFDRLASGSTGAHQVATTIADDLVTALFLLVLGLLYAVALLGVQACLVWIVAEAAVGRRRSAADAWTVVRGRLARLVGLEVLQGVAVTAAAAVVAAAAAAAIAGVAGGLRGATRVALIAGIALVGVAAVVVVGVVIYTRWVLAPAVLLLGERFPVATGAPAPGVLASLRDSRRLVRGSFWRVLGILILVALIAQVVVGIVSLPPSLVGVLVGLAGGSAGHSGPAGFGTTGLSGFGSLVGVVLALPFTVAATTLLYLDLRMRRDGLDLGAALDRGPAAGFGWGPRGPGGA